VVLHGELAVGALDFLLAGASFYPENFVVIAFCVSWQSIVLVAGILLTSGAKAPFLFALVVTAEAVTYGS
jgi:hypothetical protein